MDTLSKNMFEPGMVLNDRWIVMELIGKGGMGEVYRIHQMDMKRDIALKIISLNYLSEIEEDEFEVETVLERFKREVQVMAQISHPNVLQIFDCGTITFNKGDETISVDFITTEFIPGNTLRPTMSDDGFLPDDESMKNWISIFFMPILEGVHALNEIGIVHRDLKPENILLDGKTPKIADFGLASSNRIKALTQSMDLKGTPPYMSPEHFMDLKRTDQRTDIYALGKILYEAASGKITSEQIPFQQANLKNPKTPFFQNIDSIIQIATTVDKEKRYASVDSFRQALGDAMNRKGETPPPNEKMHLLTAFLNRRKLIGVVVFVFIGLTAAGMILYNKKHSTPMVFTQTLLRHDGNPKASTGKTGHPKPNVQGEGHSILFLIPGGSYTISKTAGAEAGQIVNISPFYMDETMVTNYQLVEFLNQVLPQIMVENETVFSGKNIWLFLGEVVKGFEPIVFQDGKFQVHGAQYANCPAFRMTAIGALAYAGFFGRRLPTTEEWTYVASKDDAKGRKHNPYQIPLDSRKDILEESFPEPVMLSEPNRYKIRGLNENIGELAVQGNEFAVMGGAFGGNATEENSFAGVQRSQWEAFSNVGFRTVMNVSVQNQ